MRRITVQQDLSHTAAQVLARRERVLISRGGRPVAAIVPLEDLDALEELDKLKEAYCIRLADEAMADDAPSIPWEQARAEAGL